MKINSQNVDSIILSNSDLRRLFPDLSPIFDAWKLGTMIPSLRPTARKASIDMLNAMDEEKIEALRVYFGEEVVVDKITYNIVKNLKIPINKLDSMLREYSGFQLSIDIENDDALVTLWR